MAKLKPTKPAGRPRVERNETFAERVGAMIRARRVARGVSVDAAAHVAGVPPATWYNFESGRHLRLERLPAIAAALGCKPRLLIPDE